MKFARLLRTTAEDLPELQCLFHIYKHLKKQLKQLPARAEGKAQGADQATRPSEDTQQHGDAAAGTSNVSARAPSEAGEEARFTAVLTEHLQRLNDRFLEREETCVIQLERLEAEATKCTAAAKAAAAEVAAAGGPDGPEAAGPSVTLNSIAEQRAQLYKRFVNFHGEVLLLVHWSVLAYTATVKILKKHHKRTGLLLRAPQLADLLSQPFCSSELMTGLARKAEACIQRLAEQLAASGTSGGTTATGGTDGAGGAASGAGGAVAAAAGPQDTVDQEAPEGPKAAAAAAAAAAGVAAAGPAGALCTYEAGTGDGGGGATFLRNLARLSDNTSAASLSGPYVLEQLVELQQFVDRYDNMDDDDPLPDDDDEDSVAVGTGSAAGAAAAVDAGGGSHARSRGGPSHGPADGAAGTRAPAEATGPAAAGAAETEPLTSGYGAAASPNSDGVHARVQHQPQLAGGVADGTAGPEAARDMAAAAVAAEPSGTVAVWPHPQQPEAPGAPGLVAAAPTAGASEANAAVAALGPAGHNGSGQGSGQGSGRGPGLGSGCGYGSGSGSGSAAAGVGAAAPSAGAQPASAQLQSSSGSAAAAAGGGSVSGLVSDAFAAPRPLAAANLLRRTQVALTMWEHLRANASTPSTVIDPTAAGQHGQAHSTGGGGSPSKRRRLGEAGGAGGMQPGGEVESVADDSGSNSD
ncbi:hypothetical protein GPECTOR_17g886 [Gonium pectorale]|uniref:SPX domain-containing protein n=1 Tax=Gonium pectorale TaxID=33097 RepID=A0A150GKB8_GONPE|nr:hypothetical protein GPECTOR_17g886 [Gonium pectorale]|eukprot:KXZ50248.1 hypothetical protein GPECTOR_17g886 [Gonium pectorale]